ncbi:MAG: hypothetical protein JRJ45_00725 [Deltaproteobacteria bacterium]|nr:hypothetical protein [Deltaproteobacteria bacterium]
MNKHFEREIGKLSKESLIRYADFMAYNWWNIQGNWMMQMSERYGTEIATEFDTLVWDRNARVQAWKLKALFDLEGDMQGLVKAISLSTVFSNVEFEFPEIDDKRSRILVSKCTMQLNRIKAGLPELPCKEPGIVCVEGFASAYNPNIKTTCLLCPPDEHSDNEWCHWLFELED